MTRLIIGAMVRAIGAYPSGWRYPGAHRDPLGDAAVLRRTAELAEEARLDYLFFGGHGITIQHAIENLPFAVWPPEARPGDVLSMTWRGEEPELSWDLVRLPRREW